MLPELVETVVILRDRHGRGARYHVDHVHDGTAICTYVFRGRHAPPTAWAPGDEVHLGAPGERGWIVGSGEVTHSGSDGGSVGVAIHHLEVVQRRQAYREELVVPFVLREHLTAPGRRGRTDNLSHGGFAARVAGPSVPEGTEVLVTFALPDHDEVTLPCRKVAGDLPERFEFVDLDRRTEDRLARLVRAAELARRRAEQTER